MKLKSKQTGEIMEFDAVLVAKDVKGNEVAHLEYNSIDKFLEEWEDVPEEPKGYYYINTHLHSVDYVDNTYENKGKDQEIGNVFETEEEAEKAVERLRAWKRLKDKGFKFTSWVYDYDQPKVKKRTYFEFVAICEDGVLSNGLDDLDLLFGGEG